MSSSKVGRLGENINLFSVRGVRSLFWMTNRNLDTGV